MSTSNSRHDSRDGVLIAIAEDMIARTSLSQDGFAERFNLELNQRVPERCRAKDYPDLKALEKTATHTDYARIYKNWSKRVERWLDGDVEIPSWIEESWVGALEYPWRERALIELTGRYGVLAVRQVGVDGMAPMVAFGGLMGRMGEVAKICSQVFDDLRIDHRDSEHLPEMIALLRAMCAKGQTLMDAAERVLADGAERTTAP